MPAKRQNKRVQFLPSLPSNDILGWVNSKATQGQLLAPGGAKSSLPDSIGATRHPTVGKNLPAKKRRHDFPLLRTGEAQPSHADAESMPPDQMRGALKELVDDMYAVSSRAPREALLRTWCKFHQQWFGHGIPVLPVTEEKLLKISSLFKKGGYKSVKNYLSRIKEHHITSGFEWNDRLDLMSKKCARSVLRGLGGARRSEAFDLETVLEGIKLSVEPLVRDGPINPAALIATATMFMLREIEASSLETSDIIFEDQSVSLRLPVSKVDWQAKGCSRTWHCLCDRNLPCVMHILEEHVKLIRDKFKGAEAALFPNAGGHVCSKQSVVDTIRQAIDVTGGSSKDGAGNWRVSGHTFRISGARMLCRWGLDPITIQLIGRWGSAAVLTYLSEAPLEGFHHRLEPSRTISQALPITELDQIHFESDLSCRVDVSSLIREHNLIVEETAGMKDQIAKIERLLEDAEHKFEGIADTIEDGQKRAEIWDVHNIISDVHHRSIADFSMSPSEWKTLCGWQYAGKPHAHTSKEITGPYRRVCPRCYPSANDEDTSESSSSTSED